MSSPKSESGFIALNGEQVSFSVFRSRKRKRTVAFKMERDSSLRVLAPFSASLGAVTRILEERAPWIIRQLAVRKTIEPSVEFVNGASFAYLGHSYRLHVTRGDEAPPSCILSPHRLHVHVPDINLSEDSLRQEVRLEIMLWLKKRARTKLKQRLDFWAARMGVAYKKLSVTDPSQRWGSCSVDNIIRLNWRLMLAPLAIVDYVVVHELAHIRHKNHSPRFWGFVAQAMPDYLVRRKRLREIERNLVF